MRPKIPKETETEILTSSKRRCCLCVGIDGNYSPRAGQIAHLDKSNSNYKVDNLAWLCLEHHTLYDSTTSQHKNYTLEEVKHYRNRLYKYLQAHSTIDKPNTERFDSTRPYCLLFDGITSWIELENEKFQTLTNFTIEFLFKIFDEKFTGILLSIDNHKNGSFYCLIYYSTEHKLYPGELHLKFIHESEQINDSLFSINLTTIKWEKLRLKINDDKFEIELGNQRISSFYNYSNFKFRSIQIGGRKWPNYQGTSFLSYYLSYFKVYDNAKDEICSELVFDYGDKYLMKLPKIEGMKLINAPRFYKMTE